MSTAKPRFWNSTGYRPMGGSLVTDSTRTMNSEVEPFQRNHDLAQGKAVVHWYRDQVRLNAVITHIPTAEVFIR